MNMSANAVTTQMKEYATIKKENMETKDSNDIFVFELPSSIRSYVKAVGVGHYGSTIVNIMSMVGLPGVDFAIVENNPIPMKCRMVDDNNIVDNNDPECEDRKSVV